jgi:peptide/nickel transport system permease protein
MRFTSPERLKTIMTTYILRRLILAFITLILVTLIMFLAVRILPGDPILLILSSAEVTETSQEEIDKLRHEFGLDKPLMMQYIDWIYGVCHGDFGQSITLREPVIKEIARRVPITLYLSFLALFVSIIVGVAGGIICAVRRSTWIDTLVTIVTNLGVTIPVFWLGIMMIYLFAIELGWLPVFGYTSPFVDFWESTKKIIMPVICLATFSMATMTRQTRSSMLEVMRQDYIRTAWSKGLTERAIIAKHALKNSLIPIVTLIGLSLTHVIGGSVLVETVFNVPGMGRLVVNAVFAQDYMMIQGVAFFIAVTVLLINLIVDISYGWLDPRIHYV